MLFQDWEAVERRQSALAIFTAVLRHRSVDFQVPSDPLADTAWILLLQRIYDLC
jgi:hypothetical protein